MDLGAKFRNLCCFKGQRNAQPPYLQNLQYIFCLFFNFSYHFQELGKELGLG